MRLLIAIAFMVICTISLPSIGQQLPVHSSWQHNPYLLNPAVTGYDMFMDFSLQGKKQWAGYKDGPLNQELSLHSSINELALGVGGHFFNDQLGTIKRSGFAVSSAYHLKLGEETKLGFGMEGSFSFYSINQDKLNLRDPNDNLLQSGFKTGLVPDVSAGLLLHRYDYMIGVSVQNILSASGDLGQNYFISDIAHYNVFATYWFSFNDKWSMMPSAQLSYIDGFDVFGDFKVSTYYNEKFILDFGGKTNGDIVLGMGMEVIDYLRVHYIADLVTSPMRSAGGSSHEILLSYDFYYNPLYKGSKRRYKWIDKVSI